MKCKQCNNSELDSTKLKFFSYCPQCNTVYDKYSWIFETSFFLYMWMIGFSVVGIILGILPGIVREFIFGFPEELRYVVFNEHMNNHPIEILIVQKITTILFLLWITTFIVWLVGNFIYDYLKDKEKKKKDVIEFIKFKSLVICNPHSLHNEIKLSFIISLLMFVIYIGICVTLVGNAYL